MSEKFVCEKIRDDLDLIFKQGDLNTATDSDNYIEGLLEELILTFFDKSKVFCDTVFTTTRQDLFDEDAVLCKVYDKILIAKHLGLLNRLIFDGLLLVRDIRNEFNDSFKGATFKTTHIKDMCEALEVLDIRKMPEMILKRHEKCDKEEFSKRFYESNVIVLAFELNFLTNHLKLHEPFECEYSGGIND